MRTHRAAILFGVLLVCLVAWTGMGHAQAPASPKDDAFTLFIASDIHFLSPRLGQEGPAYDAAATPRDGKAIRYIQIITDAFVDAIIQQKPDAVILTGDLTFNGEKASHEDLIAALRRIPPAVTQVYVIPGNHDINNVYASSFQDDQMIPAEYVSPEAFVQLYADFGMSLIRDDKDISLDYVVESPVGPWLMMLDSNLYSQNETLGYPMADGEVDYRIFPWMKRVAERANAADHPLITATHHNLYRHHPRLTSGYVIENNAELFALMQDLGVKLTFSGHIHAQDIIAYEGVTEVVSQALCLYPHQYGVLRYENGAMDYHTQRLDIAAWAKVQGLTDPNLLDYDRYARAQMDATLSNMGSRIDGEKFTPQQQADMLALVRKLNFLYFSGADVPEDVKAQETYQLLVENGGTLLSYLDFIVEDDQMDDIHLTVAP